MNIQPDINLLEKYGLKKLIEMQYIGVIERLVEAKTIRRNIGFSREENLLKDMDTIEKPIIC